MKTPNRWTVAIAGVFLQIALGAVYAWSVFRTPLSKQFGWSVLLASFSANKLWWLYLSYGFIGGLRLGLGYIVPVAVLVKWFPDKRGLITGIAVGGFGAGALITAPVATRLIQRVGVLPTFAYLGVADLVVT